MTKWKEKESENERKGKRRISSPPDFEMYSDHIPLQFSNLYILDSEIKRYLDILEKDNQTV